MIETKLCIVFSRYVHVGHMLMLMICILLEVVNWLMYLVINTCCCANVVYVMAFFICMYLAAWLYVEQHHCQAEVPSV